MAPHTPQRSERPATPCAPPTNSAPLPSLGASLLVGAAVIAVLRAGAARLVAPQYVRLVLIGIAVWLAGLAALAPAQTSIWRNDETLWASAVDSDPDCGICHGNLGEAFRAAGRLEPAIAHLGQAVARRPDKDIFHRDLGFALLQAGRAPDALPVLREAVRRLPGDPDVQSFTGLALARTGRNEEAIGHFRAAIQLAPGRADLLVNLAAAHASTERMDDARRIAERALALDPGNTPARQFIEAMAARR